MPKEQINFPQVEEIHSGSIDENGVTEQSVERRVDPTVWVAWNTGASHVQLTVSCAFSYVKDLVDAEWNQDVLVSSGTLSRSDLNKLITVLRRARDAAYGKDA